MAGRRGRGRARTSVRSWSGSTRTSELRFAGKVGSGFDGRDPARTCCARLEAARGRTSRRSIPPPPPDYKGRWGGDLAGVALGPAGARHPRRARRLVARRARPPGRVQGHRARPRPAGGRPRDRRSTRRPAGREAGAMRRAGPTAVAPEAPRSPAGAPRHRRPCAATSTLRWRAPTPSSTPSRRLGKEGTWRVGGQRAAGSRTSTRCCSRRGRRGRGARHQARPHPLLRPDRAGDAAAPRRPAAQPPALPERRRRARVLAEGHPGDRARAG